MDDYTIYDPHLLKPAFSDNNKLIVFAINDSFVSPVGVCVQSILTNCSEKSNYDIVILETNITNHHKSLLMEIAAKRSNCSIRFFNLKNVLQRYPCNIFYLGECDRFSIENYFRVFLPEICIHYKKLLYLDSDVIVCKDLTNLLEENIEDYYLAAVSDLLLLSGLFNNTKVYKKSPLTLEEYIHTLKLPDLKQYFSSGVLLMNLENLRKANFIDLFIKSLEVIKKPFLVDQDILNMVCFGKVKFLDSKYNHLVNCDPKLLVTNNPEASVLDRYLRAEKSPIILHFSGDSKPWIWGNNRFSHIFWEYARQTPFYEKLLEERWMYILTKEPSCMKKYRRLLRKRIKEIFKKCFRFLKAI